MLSALAATPGVVVPSWELLVRTWGAEYRDDVAFLRIWIRRLQCRFGAGPATAHAAQQEEAAIA